MPQVYIKISVNDSTVPIILEQRSLYLLLTSPRYTNLCWGGQLPVLIVSWPADFLELVRYWFILNNANGIVEEHSQWKQRILVILNVNDCEWRAFLLKRVGTLLVLCLNLLVGNYISERSSQRYIHSIFCGLTCVVPFKNRKAIDLCKTLYMFATKTSVHHNSLILIVHATHKISCS